MDLNELFFRQQVARSRATVLEAAAVAEEAENARKLEQEITRLTGGRVLFPNTPMIVEQAFA